MLFLFREIPLDVTKLDLSKNDLNAFPAIHFQRFKKLETLNLNQNKLTDIPEQLSVFIPSIRKIHLRGNYLIKDFSQKALDAAFNLEKIDIADSSIRQLRDALFTNNTRLRSLDFRYNKIHKIHKNAFQGLSDLHSLHLDHNQIKQLHSNVFKPLTSLRSLTIASNRLSQITNDIFMYNSNLQVIDFRRNEIKDVEAASFQNFQNISEIDLQHNQIESFSPFLFDNTYVSGSINLKHNPLSCECYLVSLELRTLRLLGKIKGRCEAPLKYKGLRVTSLTRKQLGCTTCDFNECKNNATCAIVADYYVCDCQSGFEGRFCEAVIEASSNDLDWVITLSVCLFVVGIGIVFAVWYYRKRKGFQLCSKGQCCCCCFLLIAFCILGLFFMLRIISYMYEHA